MSKEELFGLTLEEIQEKLLPLGMKKFRAQQIFCWLYDKGVFSFADMTNLSKENIAVLEEHFTLLPAHITALREQNSSDGNASKLLLALPDGNTVETVCMHHDYGHSVCVSSQVGCNMNCSFCASGLHGAVRDLSAGEILAQVYFFRQRLLPLGEKVSRVDVMGSGEPMLNLDNVLKALDIMHNEKALSMSYRGMTVSTCGIIPGIERLKQEGRTINLAISLHGASDELRTRLMPINKKYNYLRVVRAAEEYAAMNGRQVMYEYILIAGVNDSPEDAKLLAELLRYKNAVVNLIPANPVPEKGYRRPVQEKVDTFFKTLKQLHVNVTVRKEMGKDIDAACGQLRAGFLKEKLTGGSFCADCQQE